MHIFSLYPACTVAIGASVPVVTVVLGGGGTVVIIAIAIFIKKKVRGSEIYSPLVHMLVHTRTHTHTHTHTHTPHTHAVHANIKLYSSFIDHLMLPAF